MGAALSSNDDSRDTLAATISNVKYSNNTTTATKKPNTGNQQQQQRAEENSDDDDRNEVPLQSNTKSIEAPIFLDDEDDDSNPPSTSDPFPTPTGKEYDLIDTIAAELPSIIDEESNQQVQDYIEACDKGRGPMVACYSTAEYLSLFLRKHKEAETLYLNTCYRPKDDKSANAVPVDGGRSTAYPPACFNLAQMRMTGKGGTLFDRKKGYELFERGCEAGHGGSCHMQAKMLTSYPGSLGEGIPYDPRRAGSLFERVCNEGDSLSCFTLATMLLRGDGVNNEADNVMPNEARGLVPIKQRTNEADRKKESTDERKALERDPVKAESLLLMGCEERGHAPSCYNLAVMYTQGDDGVEKDEDKAKKYQAKTEEFVEKFGGFGFGGSMA